MPQLLHTNVTASAVLGTVHRRVGALEQGLQPNGPTPEEGNPRTGTNGGRIARQQCRRDLVDQPIDFTGKIHRILVIGDAFHQYRKFVAPDARQEVGAS